MCNVYCHTNIKSAVALFCFIALFCMFVLCLFCTYHFVKTKPCTFFLFVYITPPKSLFNEMSKLHLVLVFATAHFLPVGISTPNLTRAAAVLVLFILFYFFPLIFFSILSQPRTSPRLQHFCYCSFSFFSRFSLFFPLIFSIL